MLRDRRRGLHRALAGDRQERELVRDGRLEAAAVAAGVAAVRDLHGRLALERDHRFVLAEERHGERRTREVVTIVAAMATPARRCRGRQRDVLGRVGLEQIDLIDGAGLEIRDECARAVGRYREAARFAAETRAPPLLAGSGVVRDEGAIGDRRHHHGLAIGRQCDAVRLDRRLDRRRQLELVADFDDRDAVRIAVRDVRELRGRIVREHARVRADRDRRDVLAVLVGADQLSAVRIDDESAILDGRDARTREVRGGRRRRLRAADGTTEQLKARYSDVELAHDSLCHHGMGECRELERYNACEDEGGRQGAAHAHVGTNDTGARSYLHARVTSADPP